MKSKKIHGNSGNELKLSQDEYSYLKEICELLSNEIPFHLSTPLVSSDRGVYIVTGN